MGNILQHIRPLLLCGFGAAGLAACSPSSKNMNYHQADNYLSGYSQSGYGYEQSYSYDQMQVSASRYGDLGLRPACEMQVKSCGFMTVVPVYPVYQFVTAPPVAEAPPTITLPEPAPEPPVIVLPPDPEPPVYTPPSPEFWPTPETPIETWTPPRK